MLHQLIEEVISFKLLLHITGKYQLINGKNKRFHLKV
jgi:hypothetical protein